MKSSRGLKTFTREIKCLWHLNQQFYLFMPQRELPRHVGQVALLRVTLHRQVAVVLHLRRMRPVLVALGLQRVWHHQQTALALMWVMGQETVYRSSCCAALLLGYQTRIQKGCSGKKSNSSAATGRELSEWMRMYTHREGKLWKLDELQTQWSINENIWFLSNKKAETEARSCSSSPSTSDYLSHRHLAHAHVQPFFTPWNPVITHNCAVWSYLCANTTTEPPLITAIKIKPDTACNNLPVVPH